MGEELEEFKKGIGESWVDYPVLGASRDCLAPAKTVKAGNASYSLLITNISRAWPAPTIIDVNNPWDIFLAYAWFVTRYWKK